MLIDEFCGPIGYWYPNFHSFQVDTVYAKVRRHQVVLNSVQKGIASRSPQTTPLGRSDVMWPDIASTSESCGVFWGETSGKMLLCELYCNANLCWRSVGCYMLSPSLV